MYIFLTVIDRSTEHVSLGFRNEITLKKERPFLLQVLEVVSP